MKGDLQEMRKKLLAALLAFGLAITSATFIAAPAEAATETSQSSSDEDLSYGDFHVEAKKLKENDSQLKSKNGKVGASSQSSESYWGQFSGSYYYNQLDTDEKALYNKLKNLAYSYLNGTVSATSSVFSDGSSSYVTESVTQSGVDIDEALNVATIFLYENPQFYFIDSSTLPYTESYSGYWWFDSSSSWTLSFKIYSVYANGSARQSYTNQFKSAVDSYISGASAYSSDLAKETYFHDQLASDVSYNQAAADNQQIEETSESQSAASAFLMKNTVCAGCTKACSPLRISAGIENVGVTSNTHAWNEVKINGVWYVCDVTWDQNSWPTHDYFNISESELRSMDKMVEFNTSGWWSMAQTGNEWVHTPLSYYSTIRPACVTPHTSDVDAIDLTAAQKTGNTSATSDTSSSDTDTGNSNVTPSDSSSDTSADDTATNKNPEPKQIESEKPVKPNYFKVKKFRKGALQLTIKTKSNVDAYYVRYRVKGTSKWKSVIVEVNGKSLTFTIAGLKSGKTYQLIAYSVDSDVNRSNPTKVRTIKA